MNRREGSHGKCKTATFSERSEDLWLVWFCTYNSINTAAATNWLLKGTILFRAGKLRDSHLPKYCNKIVFSIGTALTCLFPLLGKPQAEMNTDTFFEKFQKSSPFWVNSLLLKDRVCARESYGNPTHFSYFNKYRMCQISESLYFNEIIGMTTSRVINVPPVLF